MRGFTRYAAPHIIALGVLLLAASAACAQTQWPSLFSYTLSLSTDDTARYQVSASLSGPLGENLGAKVQGWWIEGTGDDRAFVGDAYIDYSRDPVYVAVGRKYVIFGPAGVLVSPGFFGGEAQLNLDRFTIQAITGTLQFTPGTGTTRFTFAGSRVPSDEDITAARLALTLTAPAARVPVTLGANWIDVLDDTGTSADISVGLTEWLTLYGEAADYEDSNAHVYGIRLSDASMRTDGRAWILVYYHRDIEVGFVPAAVGASAHFEGQTGWAGGFYYQLDPQRGIGVYADRDDAILTWFQNFPL